MGSSPTQLTSHLWVTRSRFFATNSGIFINQGQACLIDPCMLPDEIQGIVLFVTEMSAVPQTLVLTHSHWDHILGPEHFPGVRVVAHENYLTQVSGRKRQRIEKLIADWEKENEIERSPQTPFKIPLPDQTFPDSMSLNVGDDLKLTMVHTPGHASDQLAVYHQESATLWASDILSDLEIPYISDGLGAYEKTLAMLSDWEIRVLVPGHGSPSTDPEEIRGRITGDMAYLAELREKVGRVILQGKTVQEAVAECTAMSYHHPEDNEGAHKLNVESVYLELGGEADPKRFGWKRTVTENAVGES